MPSAKNSLQYALNKEQRSQNSHTAATQASRAISCTRTMALRGGVFHTKTEEHTARCEWLRNGGGALLYRRRNARGNVEGDRLRKLLLARQRTSRPTCARAGSGRPGCWDTCPERVGGPGSEAGAGAGLRGRPRADRKRRWAGSAAADVHVDAVCLLVPRLPCLSLCPLPLRAGKLSPPPSPCW